MSQRSPQARAPDVAVVGGGPVGCLAALAQARAGASVVLVDAAPTAACRLAGEWLHPSAVRTLERLGVELPSDATPGHGFVVFPDDGSEPVELPYEDGVGCSCEHSALVRAMRAAVSAQPHIRVVSGRALEVRDDLLTVDSPDGVQTLRVPFVIGADGRASRMRSGAGVPEDRAFVSRMAGVELEHAELPLEGYGHVLLGGPGPVLAYRIAPSRLRLCIDVPARPSAQAASSWLWNAYSGALPQSLLPAFSAALERGRITWAANGYRTRKRASHYGRGRIALAGDAVGEFHPLTAVGMTLGFGDAETLAAGSVDTYRHKRARHARVPELLASALYLAFTRDDEGTRALRRAMYAVWRKSAAERTRTMRLLAADETTMRAFSASFLRIVGEATREIGGLDELGGLGWWLHRFATGRLGHQPG